MDMRDYKRDLEPYRTSRGTLQLPTGTKLARLATRYNNICSNIVRKVKYILSIVSAFPIK